MSSVPDLIACLNFYLIFFLGHYILCPKVIGNFVSAFAALSFSCLTNFCSFGIVRRHRLRHLILGSRLLAVYLSTIIYLFVRV